MSSETLSTTFFEDLWPLILNWNCCATDYTWTKGTTEFYEPQIKFDDLAVHEYLARHGYEDFVMPEKVSCFKQGKTTKSSTSLEESEASSTCSKLPVTNLSKRVPRPARTLSRVRISCINNLRKQRSLLKHKEREICTDMPQSLTDEESIMGTDYEEENVGDQLVNKFSDTNVKDWLSEESEVPEIKNCEPPKQVALKKLAPQETAGSKSKFVKSVLDAFLEHDAQCIFINFGQNMNISEMLRWLELSKKFHILVLTTCPKIARQVKLLSWYFHACLIDAELVRPELSYQNELEYVLNSGLKYARENKLMKYDGDIFIFVFSEYREEVNCNTFCIMKKI